MSKKNSTAVVEQASITDVYELVEYTSIVPSPDNVREDVGDVTGLATSIYQNGLQQALRVQPFNEDGLYVIIAGHRRHAALGSLIEQGLWSGPVAVMVSASTLEDHDRVAAMLVENLQRTDLNPVEEAKAFARLTKEFGYKQSELASKIGRSASYVSDRLALLKLPDVAIDLVRIGKIRLELGVALSKVGDDAKVAHICSRNGELVSMAAIESAANEVKADKLAKRMLEELSALTIEVVSKPKPWDWHTLSEITDPKQFAELASFPKSAVAYLNIRRWNGEVMVVIARPATEAEKAKKEDAARDEQSKWQADRAAAEQARYEKELASKSDAEREWLQRCDELKAEHETAVMAYNAELESVRRTWVETVSTKDIARLAMLEAASMVYVQGALRFFNIEVIAGSDLTDTLNEWANESAANLTKLVAFSLAIDAPDDDTPAVKALDAFIAKQKIVEPVLVLPPAPDNPDADELEDGEAAARAEAEAAQDSYEEGDLGDDD